MSDQAKVTVIGEAGEEQVQQLIELHRSLGPLKTRIGELEVEKAKTLANLVQNSNAIQVIIDDIKSTLNIPDDVKWDVRSDGKVVALNVEPPSSEGGGEE